MASRVDFLIQAVDRASKTFDSIAKSGKILDRQLSDVSRTTQVLDERFKRVKDSSRGAADGLDRVDRSARKAADNLRTAANQGERVARWNQAAADSARNLSRELDKAARSADKEALAARAAADEMDHLARATLAQRAAMAGMTQGQAAAAAVAAAAGAAQVSAARKTQQALSGNQASIATLGRGWRFLGQEVTLFAGLAKPVSVWHVVLDSIVEALAVMVPALSAVTFGLAAFGAAGYDAGKQIYTFLLNIHQIRDATGQALPPLTNNLEKLHEAVKPMVFQLFGDAILIASKKSKLFNEAALQTGSVLDRMGLKITSAILHSSGGLEKFFKTGAQDAHQFGIVLENIGKVILKLVQVSEHTHIAEFLLEALVVASKLLALVARLPTPILAVAFALHGIYLWGGIAVTQVAKLLGVLAKMAGAAGGIKAVNTATAGLGASAKPVEKLKATFQDLALGVQAIPGRVASIGKAVAGALKPVGLLDRIGAQLIKIPIAGWAAGAVLAIGIFTAFALKAKDATEKWVDRLNQGILRSPIDKALVAISNAQELVSAKLKESTAAIHQQTEAVKNGNENYVAFTRNTLATSKSVGELTNEQKLLSQETQTYSGRLEGVQRVAGKTADAQGLLVAAGITTSDMLSHQKDAWALIDTAVRATLVAYADMGQTGTALTHDLEVLDRTTNDQQMAIQKLNQAWNAFISSMTDTQTSFDTFALGADSLNKAFSKVADSSVKIKHHIGDVAVTLDGGKSSMDGLSTASLELNQSFEQQIGNIEKLLESLRQANVSENMFNKGVKDSIAPMLKYAKGSQEATDQLVALAQEAGFNGPASFASLVKWVGNTHGAMRDLKNITNQATQQDALLTDAMDAQSKMIANKLLGDLDQAILKYGHVTQDVQAYGRAIAESGRESDAAHGARNKLIADIMQTGVEAGKSKSAIAGMIATILHIPLRKALQLVMHGDGSFQIGEVITRNAKGTGGKFITNKAAGGMVSGGTPGKDSVLANLMPGEVVVPTRMVSAGAVDHLRGSLPGFAAGGLVTGSGRSVLSGQFVNKAENAYTANAENHMVTAMRAAMSAAEHAAIAARAAASGGGGSGVPGPGGGAPAANAALARKMMPSWGSGAEWSAWNNVAIAESGWNQYARNASSGAYGIPQALPPSKMGAAANPPQSNPHAQISWMIGYIKGRYGDPIGAWNFHLAHGWYDKGGVLKPGTTLAVNNTGHDELVVNPALMKPGPGAGGGGPVGKEASGNGGGKGVAVIVNGFGAGGASDINRIVKTLKSILDALNASSAALGSGSGDGGGGIIAPEPGGGPKKGTPPIPHHPITMGGISYDAHLHALYEQHTQAVRLAKDTKNLTVTGAAILKAEQEHRSQAFINQLKALFAVEKKDRAEAQKRLKQARTAAGNLYEPDPLTKLNQSLRQSQSALKEDKKELEKAKKDHANPTWIKQLEKLEKQAAARVKNEQKEIKAERDHQMKVLAGKDGKGGGSVKTKPVKGGGGGKGPGSGGGGLGTGGGASAGSAGVREEVAVLKEIRTAVKLAKDELVSIRALLKQDLDKIASNTEPARQAAAGAKAMQSTATSAGKAGLNKTRRP